ncbi:hypothetical protein BCU68_01175 [Vibrio sp. 10N.286.49.B3]|uniref:PepSY domain-containing protein n=1 Tax=Vibrio sp. 10N.286.49.B3 TaxID=1880855 RepID=UPI000C8162AE|nr:PepSY domain-containing protein [Vibrio sp. 10N.286.49.B3]PMH46676.1 hypothetical protein BCU68_01175 [Vibrio sp. 10N.286.49.B3]
MYRINHKTIITCALLGLMSPFALAQQSDTNGYHLVQDSEQISNVNIKFDEDQDEVYAAVQAGLIQPFSELYATVNRQIKGRIIRVELEEDDNEWAYELRLMHNDQIIKVEYNAATLELLELKGRDLYNVIKHP